ncbi:leucine-rich repeat protein [Dysgonomonas sp. 520]|uniref:InlB B-repeat-containing protein n=1 Tax=Dysgonomonas sp. 520 TaxID=2302931 RepID=UPI0013D462CD|nr:leucine-rich repeat protein [Dysgonomonas sp. 520]NDW09956.1 T9SS C-terminal target domain-containing protein [Dysgonomonas sp. 520]
MRNIISFLKKQLTVILLLALAAPLSAQVEKIIDLKQTKTLGTLLTAAEKSSITKLIVTTSNGAVLDQTDFNVIYMEMPKLEELDLLGDWNSTHCAGLKVSNDFTNKTIKKIHFPPKTRTFGNFAGSGLEGVVEFPNTIQDYTMIENRFIDCQGITGFAFPDGHPTLSTNDKGTILFSSFSYTENGNLQGKRICLYLPANKEFAYTMPDDAVAIGLSAFGYNKYLTELTFSPNLVEIFRQNGNVRVDVIAPQTPNLKAIHVPESNSVFASTENGFLIDKSTNSLILLPPANKDEEIFIDGTFAKKIGNKFFSNSPHIKSVVFGEGVEEIGSMAFKGYDMQIEYVSMPSTMKSIGAEAFAVCQNMKQYICKATTPPAFAGNDIFYSANGTGVKVGVPAEAIAAYKTSNWVRNANYSHSFSADQILSYHNITCNNATTALDISVSGSQMRITAGEAPLGEAFYEWKSEPEGVVFENVNASPTYFTMPENDVTITATFAAAKPYTIENAITQSGFAAIDGIVTIEAAETKGTSNNELFQYWEIVEGNGLVIDDPSSPVTSFVMINGTVTIRAVYKTKYMLSIRGGSATFAGEKILDAFSDETISITATKRPNMEFVNWSSSTPGVVFADENNTTTTFVMPAVDAEIQANYKGTPGTGSGFGSPSGVYPNNCFNGELTDYQTSWLANSGGTPRTHVPHSMDALFVREDGTVATICNWDEGGTNVGVWKDGKIVSIPVESGTGSWGRNSGKAVALDDQYVYQLMRFNGNSGNESLNSNGLRSYPPKASGVEWQLITRYNANDGSAAKFSEGYGPLANMLLVAPQEERLLRGLAITDNELIVAVPGITALQIPDSIKIYDKQTMSNTSIGGFRIDEGGVGFLFADKRGFVWMLQGNRIVAINLRNGGIRSESIINLPADVVAKSFSIDTDDCGKERLLVANSGKDLNVLIYTDIYENPKLTGTFGQKGGLLVKAPKPEGGEYLQGEAGHLRFPGPTGVGVDKHGNIYVSTMFVNSASAILYSYKEEAQTLNWKQEGLVFTSTGDFDETQLNKVYCIEKVYELDYDKKGKRMDTFIGTTVDPFTYPLDMRLEPNPPTPIKTGTFKRRINGTDYLFVTNMYSTILGGYRFDKENHGYIGVPCMELRADGITFWEDTNGDGQKTDSEVTRYPSSGNTFSIYPDKNGNIWLADNANMVVNGPAFRIWKQVGQSADKVLKYDAPVTYKLPSYITLVNRVLYDAERDEMLVACYTKNNPNPHQSIWGQVGTTVLTFKNMTERFANIATVPSSEWIADQELVIPASPKAAIGTPADPGVEISAKAMTYVGDYLFFHLATGNINVYERAGDNLFVGQITPGAEVEKRVGWTDFTYSINGRKNTDGTYELLAEENAFAKLLHYDINSFDGNLVLTGDLVPERIWVQNGDKENIDNINIPEGQPIKFTVRVRNLESGTVVNSRRTDPGRCLVLYTVTDLNTNQIVYEAQSNIHTENIYGGDYIDISVLNNDKTPFWVYKKGNYRVDVDVNYGRKGKECSADNNYMSFEFGGGDNTGAITGPTEPPMDGIEMAEATSVKVYPNPASTTLHVQVDTPESEYTVIFTSMDGRNVMTKRIANGSTIDISGLSKGYYLLQVKTLKENLIEKIIIK